MSINPIVGQPGMQAVKTASQRVVFKSKSGEAYLPGGKLIDGSESGDPGNTGDVRQLRAGLLMGKITTTGLFAPTIVGVTTAAYTSGGTTLTVSAAQATELARLVGQSGTAELVAIGPPSAAGTVAVTDVDHSAIDTATGDITVTSLGVNKIAGTFLAVKDGRQTPITLIPDGWPIRVTDTDGTDVDVDFPLVPIGGVIDSSQLVNWPSDTSLRSWIVSSLNTTGIGHYTFDHLLNI
jgi:hypothetical protein